MAATFGRAVGGARGNRFQSPCHRGDGCNSSNFDAFVTALALSVPLSSGRWLQQPAEYRRRLDPSPFSPLVIGAMAATIEHGVKAMASLFLSVPLSSGRWLQRINRRRPGHAHCVFQSPCHRGDGCNLSGELKDAVGADFQSPCHRGDGCNSMWTRSYFVSTAFQSPCHRGDGCNFAKHFSHQGNRCLFQSPCHRGDGCNVL